MDVNKGGALGGNRDGIVRVVGRWSSRLCCSMLVVGKFYRRLIQYRLLSLI